jgi:hypothetical protein
MAAPLVVLTSRRATGEALERAGFLTTPDDHGVSAMPVVFRAVRPAAPAQGVPARLPIQNG